MFIGLRGSLNLHGKTSDKRERSVSERARSLIVEVAWVVQALVCLQTKKDNGRVP